MLRDEKRVSFEGKTRIRYKSRGKKFELVVDPDLAYKIKNGTAELSDENIYDVLEIDEIFEDAAKGVRASQEDLIEVFGTTELNEIVKKMFKKGELLLTKEIRQELYEKKKNQIIAFISKNCVDPRTKLPHPPARIENALKEISYPISIYKSAEEQAREIIKELKKVLPIRFEKVKMALKIPAEYVGKAYGEVKKHAEIVKEEWGNDGSWIALVQLAAGVVPDFLDRLGRLTQGLYEMKILEREQL